MFSELTHLWGMVNTATQQSTPVLLFFLILKWTACKLTLSHFGSQFQWSKWKQILTIECVILEDRDTYYCRPATFTKEQGQLNWQRLLQRSVQYAVFSSPKHWKCHDTGEWINFLFWVVYLDAPINLPSISAFYQLYLLLGNLMWYHKTDFRSVISAKKIH